MGRRAFYVLSFVTENISFCYDLTTQTWTQWGYWNTGTAAYERYLGQNFTYATNWGIFLVGDRSDSIVWKLEADAYEDGSDDIRTMIRTGNIDHGTHQTKVSKALRLKFKRGTGTATTEPVATVRWRDDNGQWQVTTGINISQGATGDYEYFKDMYPMGVYKTRQYEIVFKHDADFILAGIDELVEVVGR